MSYPFGYNSGSILFPPDGLDPASVHIDIDDLLVVGVTGDAAKAAKYVARTESGANTGTCVASTATVAGAFGVALSTPGSATGNRVVQEVANFLTSATLPISMETRVKFVTGGTYFIGWSKVTATDTATVTSSGLASGIYGAGALIQSDDYLDAIARGGDDTASTALTNQIFLTAGTWYRIGVKTWPTVTEIYVNGKIASKITHTTLAASAVTPHVGTCGAGTTKILSIDLVGTMASRG